MCASFGGYELFEWPGAICQDRVLIGVNRSTAFNAVRLIASAFIASLALRVKSRYVRQLRLYASL